MDLHATPDGVVHCIDVDGADHTGTLQTWISATIGALRPVQPDLFILKSKSPSCGIRPPMPGLFAAALRENFPSAAFFDETDLPLPAFPSQAAPDA